MEFCLSNGRGLPCGPMYALSVCAFDLVNALSFPQATCMFLNQVALSISCLFLKSNWQKQSLQKELNDVALYRLEMSSIKYSKHLTS